MTQDRILQPWRSRNSGLPTAGHDVRSAGRANGMDPIILPHPPGLFLWAPECHANHLPGCNAGQVLFREQ
jgi:hypothetical protein